MYNRAVLIGRLTAAPELKTTPSGVSVCSFTLAVDRRFKGRDGEKQADFIGIVTWRQTAEFVSRYFRKGDPIGIEGSIQTRNYEDKQGNKRTSVEVVADGAFFVGGKQSRDSGENAPSGQNSGPGDFEEVDGAWDTPF